MKQNLDVQKIVKVIVMQQQQQQIQQNRESTQKSQLYLQKAINPQQHDPNQTHTSKQKSNDQSIQYQQQSLIDHSHFYHQQSSIQDEKHEQNKKLQVKKVKQKQEGVQQQMRQNVLNNTAVDINNQCDRYDQNNMTFSQAIQTNYQNLAEFRSIHIDHQQPQHQQQNQLFSLKPIQTLQQKHFNLIADNSSLNQKNNKQLNINQINFQIKDAVDSNDMIDLQSNNINVNDNQQQMESIDIDIDQKQNLKKIMLNNLLQKGQIKMFKGNRKNCKITTSKQNSLPPSSKNKQTIQLQQNYMTITQNQNDLNIDNESQILQDNELKIKKSESNQIIVKKKETNKMINKNFQQIKNNTCHSANAGRTSPNIVENQQADQFQNKIMSGHIDQQYLQQEQQQIQTFKIQDQNFDQKNPLTQQESVQYNMQINKKNIIFPGKSFKKIRKPSHQKHNSLERGHQQKIQNHQQEIKNQIIKDIIEKDQNLIYQNQLGQQKQKSEVLQNQQSKIVDYNKKHIVSKQQASITVESKSLRLKKIVDIQNVEQRTKSQNEVSSKKQTNNNQKQKIQNEALDSKYCRSYDDTNKQQNKFQVKVLFRKNDLNQNKKNMLVYNTSNRKSKSNYSPAKQQLIKQQYVNKQQNLKQFSTFDNRNQVLQNQQKKKEDIQNDQAVRKLKFNQQQQQAKKEQKINNEILSNNQIINSDTGGSGHSNIYGTQHNRSEEDKIIFMKQLESQKLDQVSLISKADNQRLNSNLPFTHHKEIGESTDFKYKSFDLHQTHHHQKLLHQQRLQQQKDIYQCQNQLSQKNSQSIFKKGESSSGDQIQPSASPATGENIHNSQQNNKINAISSSQSNQIQSYKEMIKKQILINQRQQINVENSNQGLSENAIIYSSINKQNEKIVEVECLDKVQSANRSQVKSVKTSIKSKQNGINSIYKTEDYRSSLSKWGIGKKSSGPSSGNQQKFDQKGIQKEQFKNEIEAVCGKDNTTIFMNKMITTARESKQNNNFLDEFSQFEEQYELGIINQKSKQIEKKKNSLKNEKIVKSIRHVNKNNQNENNKSLIKLQENKHNSNVSAPLKIQKLKSIIMDQDQKTIYENQQNNQNKIEEQKKSSNSLNNLVKRNQQAIINDNNQKPQEIGKQYQNYMKNFQKAITQKLIEQQKVIDNQASCQQCHLYQQAQIRQSSEDQICNDQIDGDALDQYAQPQLNYLGTYNGLDYQYVQHAQSIRPFLPNSNINQPPQIMCPKHMNQYIRANSNNNQIYSQSKIIIPRGIINFKKVHSVSIERVSNKGSFSNNQSIKQSFNDLKDPLKPQIFQQKKNNYIDNQHLMSQIQAFEQINENNNYAQTQKHTRENSLIEVNNNKSQYEADEIFKSVQKNQLTTFHNGMNTNQKTFMLEPRDESLMRKKKVIEILKTFQEEGPDVQKQKNDQNIVEEEQKIDSLMLNNQFGDEILQLNNKVRQVHEQKEKKKSFQLESFIKDPFQSNTFYHGKPIIIKQHNRVKNNQKVRRRDQKIDQDNPINQKQTKNNQQQKRDLMSDLNNFIMIEDLKINQDEEKFLEQKQQNILFDFENRKQNNLLKSYDNSDKQISDEILVNQNNDFYHNIDFIADLEQQNQDLGLNFIQNCNSGDNEQYNQQFESSQIDYSRITLNDFDNIRESLNLQNQIQNIDQIFEPEPEYIQAQSNSSRIQFNS